MKKEYQEDRFKLLNEIYPNFLLVYREGRQSNWADRAIYGSEYYNKDKLYNHRVIFPNETVLEYDENTKNKNKLYTAVIRNRLMKLNINFDMWHSGNKSIHIHTFWNIPEVKYLSVLKKGIMLTLTENMIDPDLRLCSDGHLIRAEYGLHESSGKHKLPLKHNSRLFQFNKITQSMWNKYNSLVSEILHTKVITNPTKIKDHPGFKILFNPDSFKEVNDGRERVMFFLLQVLKSDYSNWNDLFVFIYDWYKYSGGYKLDKEDIRRKTKYHWDKDYCMSVNYLERLLDELGIKIPL